MTRRIAVAGATPAPRRADVPRALARIVEQAMDVIGAPLRRARTRR